MSDYINRFKRKTKPGQLSRPVQLASALSILVLAVYFIVIFSVVITLERQDNHNRNLAVGTIYGSDVTYFREEKLPIDETIPKAAWPIRRQNEVNQMESIVHPADPNITWEVPTFWSPPIHHNRLMSRETALKIGTCSVPNSSGEYVRGANCPITQRTLFVMIASYRDFQCRETVAQIFDRAAHPERIRVGVVDQITEGVDVPCNKPMRSCKVDPAQALCKYAQQIDVLTMDAATSVGPAPARHVGNRMYRGEYYAMQVDAHVSFINNWEMSLMLELESTGNEMAVLSTYLSDFVNSINKEGDSIRFTRPIMCNSRWQEALGGYHIHHSTQPEVNPIIHGMPTLHPWWSAGFSFSRGHFMVNVPYDLYQPMVFSGEEMSIAIRAWTVGYDLYTPERSACFHHYAESTEGKAKRDNVPLFWENSEKYQNSGVKAMRRLLGIVHLNPGVDPKTWDHTGEDIYGLGGVRAPEKLLEILGMDVVNRTVEDRLCRFVNLKARMHRMFTKFLRSDGMGIDYSTITYQYKYNPNDEAADDVQETEGEEGDDAEGEYDEEDAEEGNQDDDNEGTGEDLENGWDNQKAAE